MKRTAGRSAVRKNAFREIKGTVSRFLSIFGIVAIGVGFFSGVKASSPDMKATADKYYTDNRLMDFRAVSTYGFNDNDVEALKSVTGAEIYPTYYFDALVNCDGRPPAAARLMALGEHLNYVDNITIVDGRMPEKPNECLVNSNKMKGGPRVGSVVSFTDGDGELPDDMMTVFEYTIVGSYNTPMYIDKTARGNTSIGNGSIESVYLIPEENFCIEYYTEAYVRVPELAGLNTYSDEYKDRIDEIKDMFEAVADRRTVERYDEILSEANEKIADGEKELADAEKEADEKIADGEREIADAKEQLADAEKTISDAEKEIADGEKKLEDGRKELEDGRKDLADGKKELADNEREYDEKITDAEKEIADAEKEIAENEQKLIDGQKEYDDGYAEYLDGLRQFEDGKKEYEDGLKKYNDGLAELKDAEKKYNDGLKQYRSGETDLIAAGEELKRSQAQLADAERQLNAAKAQLDAAEAEINANESQLSSAKAQLDAGKAQLDANEAQLNAAKAQLDSTAAQLDSAKAELDAGEQMLQVAAAIYGTDSAEYNGALMQYNAGKAQYDAGKAQYDAGLAQYNAGKAQFDAGKAEYERNLAQYEAGKAEFDAGKAQFEAGKAEYNANKAQFDAGKAQYDMGRDQYSSGVLSLQSARTELDDAKKQIDDGKKELEDAKKELDDAAKEIAENEQKLKDAKKELDDAKAELEDGWKQLNDGKKELADAKAELADNKVEAEQKFADARRDIADAEKKLADGEVELVDGEKELADAKQKLSDGKADYEQGLKDVEKGEKELEDGKKEADEKISDAKNELADAKEKLADLDKPKWYIFTRDDNPGFTEYGENAERINNIASVFPVFFVLVAILVCLTTMSRMVEEQRVQIGTFKALGYGNKTVIYKYMLYALTATVTGAVTGVLIGMHLFPYVIITAYGMMYDIPELVMNIDVPVASFAMVFFVAAIALTVYFSCRSVLKEQSAQLMRPKAPKNGKRILLEHIKPIWAMLGFSSKVTARNLFRYKRKMLMTVIGVSGCTALLLTGFALYDSINDIIAKQYGELQHYDGIIAYDYEGYPDAADDAESVVAQYGESVRVFQKRMTITGNSNKKVDAYVAAPSDAEKFTEFMTVRDRVSGQKLELTDGKVYIDEKLSLLLNVKGGDTIHLSSSDTEDYSVEITGAFENYPNHFIYMTDATYESVFGEKPEYNTLYFTHNLGEEGEDALAEEIFKKDGILAVTFNSSTMGSFRDMLAPLNFVIWVIILSAGLLAFVVLYNLTNINITERIREIATLKVLGFYDGEVDSYIFRENIILSLLGTGAGLILGVFLANFVITTAEVDLVMFGRNIYPPSFLLAALVTVLFSVLVTVCMHGRLKNINMIEALKSIE